MCIGIKKPSGLEILHQLFNTLYLLLFGTFAPPPPTSNPLYKLALATHFVSFYSFHSGYSLILLLLFSAIGNAFSSPDQYSLAYLVVFNEVASWQHTSV